MSKIKKLSLNIYPVEAGGFSSASTRSMEELREAVIETREMVNKLISMVTEKVDGAK